MYKLQRINELQKLRENIAKSKQMDNILLYNICNKIDDIIKIREISNTHELEYFIISIDNIYSCVQKYCKKAKVKYIEIPDFDKFKFIRDFINHPDGLNNRRYQEIEICKKMLNNEGTLSDFYIEPCISSKLRLAVCNQQYFLFENKKDIHNDTYFIFCIKESIPKKEIETKHLYCSYTSVENILIEILTNFIKLL